MDEKIAAQTLSALGNEKRLEVFRLLIQAGHDGLNISDIQVRLSMPASTLSHHIAALAKTDLVSQQKHGREVICTANYETMETVFAFMTEQCCVGVGPMRDTGKFAFTAPLSCPSSNKTWNTNR